MLSRDDIVGRRTRSGGDGERRLTTGVGSQSRSGRSACSSMEASPGANRAAIRGIEQRRRVRGYSEDRE
jgi:hypothetical protein